MTAAERDQFENTLFKGSGKNRTENVANLRSRLVVLCAVNESGDRIFSDDDAEALGRKNAAAVDIVFSVAQKLNGLSENDVDDLVKNSEGDQDDDIT